MTINPTVSTAKIPLNIEYQIDDGYGGTLSEFLNVIINDTPYFASPLVDQIILANTGTI